MTERPSSVLPTNKTFEGICLDLAGKFLQKELWIIFVFKTIRWKKNSFKLIYEHVNDKVTQDLICIC